MTAVGAIIGINLGAHQLSQTDDPGTAQASLVDTTREVETAQQQALEEARAAAQRQAALKAAQEAARQKAAAAAAAKAKAAAKADAAAKAAREKAAEEAARAKEAEEASRSENRTPINVEPGSAKDIARQKVAARGWSTSEFECLVKLWDKESGWRVNASNPSTGAYGIPQALPGSKMESAGSDWKTNPATQIEWGLDYIKSRYDTPCGAWSHFQDSGWY